MSLKRRKLLVFAQSGVGGAERMSVTITKTLDPSHFEVKYYLLGEVKEGIAPLEKFIPQKLIVHHIISTNPIILIAYFFGILLREQPDIVFSSVLNINNKLLLLKYIFHKTKFVARCDNYLYTYTDKQKLAVKRTYSLADIIIAQTDEMKYELCNQIKIPNDKILVLQNPVDIETIKLKIREGNNPYTNEKKIRYVASGRFAYQKGFDMLIESFNIVKQHQPDSELYIIGRNDGDCSDYYISVLDIIKKYKLEESVHCVGFQSNPYVFVKYATCFVLSSRWEGLPNVLIESLYLGTPVAAFKCIPVIERIISENVDGFLAEKNNIYSLAESMLKASSLGRVHTNYKSANISDFHSIFNT